MGSREELDRMNHLREEFDAFADQRLVSGGNVHRQEIVNAFRRFHSKYRNLDNDELLSDRSRTSNETMGASPYGE